MKPNNVEMCLKWIEYCHCKGECNTRKLFYLQSVSFPVGQQSWKLNHWLWYYFYWFSWKTGLSWVAKMTLYRSFFLLPVLPWDNTPQLGTTPSSLQSTTLVGTVSGTPGSQETALLAAVLNWCLNFSLTLMDLLPLPFSQLSLSQEQAAAQGPVPCSGSCRMRSQALVLINIHC